MGNFIDWLLGRKKKKSLSTKFTITDKPSTLELKPEYRRHTTKPVVVPKIQVIEKPAPVVPKLEWFCTEVPMSPAEEIIANLLNLYRVSWAREVSFKEFRSSKYGHYRFDFYLPNHKLIIEYDSPQWHSSPDRIAVDTIKDQWCYRNGLDVRRFTNKHYYSMATHIDKLMKEHKIHKK